MATNGRKRKRESADDDITDSKDGGDISLQAFEAVINPIDRQWQVNLASDKSGSVSSTGLIEWNVSNRNEPVLMDRSVWNWLPVMPSEALTI
jgi:hypothetical protein